MHKMVLQACIEVMILVVPSVNGVTYRRIITNKKQVDHF